MLMRYVSMLLYFMNKPKIPGFFSYYLKAIFALKSYFYLEK